MAAIHNKSIATFNYVQLDDGGASQESEAYLSKYRQGMFALAWRVQYNPQVFPSTAKDYI